MPAKSKGFAKIQSDFPSKVEEDLMQQVCKGKNHKHAFLRRFNRFGFSGARLLLVNFNKTPDGVTYLLKVSKIGKAIREKSGVNVLKADVMDATQVDTGPYSATDESGQRWGALLYMYHGQGTGAVTGALRDLVFSTASSDSGVRSILKQVYQRLGDAHSRKDKKRVPLRKHFEPYFRDHIARNRIRSVLGRDADTANVKFLGAQIYNPLWYLDELPKYRDLFVSPVHGDLHPDNVVIDQDGVARLIDFGWADKGRDVLVDFALLENSIRFMAFPRPMNLSDQLQVDRALVDEEGFKRISEIELCYPKNRVHYIRLACVVAAIRRTARSLLGEQFSMQNYLLTQFILLYGLLSYRDYEPYAGTRALGLMSRRLKDTGLPA